MATTTLENLRQQPNLAKKITDILSEKFIYTDNIAEILAAAIYSGQNVILFGPGGHGKSEMVEAVLEGLGLWDRANPDNSETLIQSFGEGLTEDALWGGIDFKKLNCPTNPDMVFNVENSFLKYPVAVFEELFDAPAFCLLPLKHTLQAGFLAKNGKSYKMQTKLIIACTNRNPDEIGEMGETYRALLERFVLRQEVAWEKYDASAYLMLINKHKKLVMGDTEKALLANLMEECQDSGHTISPRTAMKAIDVLIGSAISQGRTQVISADFVALKHITGFQAMAVKLQESLSSKAAEISAREILEKHIAAARALDSKYTAGLKVLEYCVLAKQYALLTDAFNEIRVPDRLYSERTKLVEHCSKMHEACKTQAINSTRAEITI